MPIRLIFHGAAGAVTGSCFMLESHRSRVLIDCGLFQGPKTEKELNYRPFPFAAQSVDCVVLTHAHIDHCGLLPKLVRAGFSGPVYATAATADLCSVMLPDSASIQEMEVEQLNRRNLRRGRPTVEPIYTAEDAAVCLTQFRPLRYAEWTVIADGVRVRFWNAGHLLGSASAEIEVDADGQKVRLLFSGDIGPDNKLLQHNPQGPCDLDYVVCEATYGHKVRAGTSHAERREQLRAMVQDANRPRGVLLIPSFAVERTQELLVDLVGLMNDGALPYIPIFIDSPLASRASVAFSRHASSLADGPALIQALQSHNVRFTESAEQSKAIDRIRSFHIILAASGMCEAGRIRHHLKAKLWSDDTTVLLVGFQAQGTLGRILQDGAPRVRIMGEEVQVRARIRSIDLYSGHADAAELAAWISNRKPIRRGLFLVHAEQEGIAGLRHRLAAEFPGLVINAPELDEAFDLAPEGPVRAPTTPRVPPERLGHLDWHNDLSRLLLDIGGAVNAAADERGRAKIIRRLRRALQPGPSD